MSKKKGIPENLAKLREINKEMSRIKRMDRGEKDIMRIAKLLEIRGELKFKCYVCGKESKLKWMKSIGEKALCNSCDHNRCKKCDVLLRKNYKCKTCGHKHGDYSEETLPYCKECSKLIINKKENEI